MLHCFENDLLDALFAGKASIGTARYPEAAIIVDGVTTDGKRLFCERIGEKRLFWRDHDFTTGRSSAFPMFFCLLMMVFAILLSMLFWATRCWISNCLS